MRSLPLAFVLVAATASLTASCSREYRRAREEAFRNYRSERGCLPCHAEIRPVEPAANHNYQCTVCHAGDPTSHRKDKAHRDLIAHPQEPAVIHRTCEICHNETLSPEIPYNAAFVEHMRVAHPKAD